MREGTKPRPATAQNFIIKRPRLTKLLDDSGARLILLVAPAGYGKTTLAREWTSAFRRPLAWYQASTASSDVAALATGLAVELDQAVGDGTTAAYDRMAAMTPYQPQPDVLARALARSVEWPRNLIVVVDDYHRLAESGAAERLVDGLTELIPATFVVASRVRPTWFKPRQILYGEAVMLGPDELAMTAPEAQAVLPQNTQPSGLEPARGWPVAIGLAARTGRTAFPRGALPRHLYRFLADDLIQTTTPTTQRALTVLALSGTRDEPLARQLIGSAADEAISEAEKRGLLNLEPAGQLALHPLLADYLIERLRGDTPAILDPLVRDLTKRRQWDECLHVAEACPDASAFAGDVLNLALEDLLHNGRTETVSRWVGVGRTLGLDDPIFDLAEGEVAFRNGAHDQALGLASHASRCLQLDKGRRARAELLAGRAAHFSERRDEARAWFKSAECTSDSSSIRADALWGIFIVEYEEDTRELERALLEFVAAGNESVGHEIRAATGKVFLALSEGSVADSLDSVDRALALAPLCDDPLLRLAAYSVCASTLVCAARYDEAMQVSERFIEDALESEIAFAVCHALVSKASAMIGARRFAAARAACTELRKRLDEEPYGWAETNLALRHARIRLSLNDLEGAAEHLVGTPHEPTYTSNRAECDAYRALIEAARGHAATAESWASRAETTRHAESYGVACVARAILSIDAEDGCDAEMLLHFDRALMSGHKDAIVIGCRAQPELAKRVATHPRYRDDLLAILNASNDEPIARAAGLEVPRAKRRIATLSPREVEVYELLVQGRTNRQIAQTLFITESTTKIHVRHIFEKLGVRTRVEAVRAWSEYDGS